MKLSVQGERISSVDEVINWFPERPAGKTTAPGAAFRAAMGEEVPAAELERARIRSHLRALAAVLDLAGLEAVARRFLISDTAEPRRLRRLFRAAERRGLRRVLQGVGRISRDQAKEIGLVGPPARSRPR